MNEIHPTLKRVGFLSESLRDLLYIIKNIFTKSGNFNQLRLQT